jgi:hypothetical protein
MGNNYPETRANLGLAFAQMLLNKFINRVILILTDGVAIKTLWASRGEKCTRRDSINN